MANDQNGRSGEGLIEVLDDDLLEEAELVLDDGESDEFEDEATAVFQPGVHTVDDDDGGFEEEATRVFDPNEEDDGEFEDEATRVWQSSTPEPAAPRPAVAAAAALAARAAAPAAQASSSHYAQKASAPGKFTTQLPQSGVSATTGSRQAVDAFPDEATVVTDSAALYASSAASRTARPEQQPQVARPRASAAVPVAGQRKSNGLAIAVISLLVLALGAVAFLFYQSQSGGAEKTGTVALFSSPPGATVTLDGQTLANSTPTTLADLVLGESHVIRLELSGYQPIEETIVVSTEGLQQRQFELQPSTGSVTIRTVPPGAAVTVDGVARGASPLSVEDLDVSRAHEIVATLDGYEVGRRTVSFSEAGPREQLVAVNLVAIPPAEPAEGSGLADGSGEAAPVEEVVAAAQVAEPEPEEERSSRRSSSSSSSSSRSDSSSSSRSDREETSARTTRPSDRTSRPSDRTSRPSARTSDTSGTRERPSSTRPSEAVAPEPSGTGTISVQAVPFGQVWVDGRMVSPETPLINHELDAGVHRVKVYYVNLRQFSDERSVRVEPDGNRTLTFRAQR